MSANCPTCGRKMPVAKPSKAESPVDLSQMTDRELFAHYKRIAHIKDVRFMAERARMSPELAHRVTLLLMRAEAGLSRADTLREHAANLAIWRQERADAERMAAIANGTWTVDDRKYGTQPTEQVA